MGQTRRASRSLMHLIRQQVRYWRLNAKREAVQMEPPERNAYPGLAWDSPLRRAQMEAVRASREEWRAA